MGSSFAGVKAGILGGVFFAGAIGAFNALLLLVFEGDVLRLLSTLAECSGSASTGGVATAGDCFSTLLTVSLPFFAFIAFVVSLVFAASFGALFDFIPGRSYGVRALIASLAMLLAVIYLGAGVVLSELQHLIMVGFEVFATLVYAVILARYYRRYTREVQFQAAEPGKEEILVDKRNLTGKTRTFSLHSSHKVRASVQEGPFKEWLVSGGVTVEDSRSFETSMTVEGDGLLKCSSSRGR